MDPLAMAHALADAAYDAYCDTAGRGDLHDIVGIGADDTPTTRLDDILDQAILAAAADFGIGTVSEESGRRDGETPLWAYVDPLDGSRNAARGIPFYATTVAIATGEGADALQSGVTRNLITGDRYAALRSGGFTINGGPPPHVPFDARDMVVAVIADSSVDVDREQERRHHIRDLGSAALEMALVASGGLDAMVVREPWLRSIDIAAGVLMVREAGGQVSDGTGGPVDLSFDVGRPISVMAARNAAAMEAA